MGNIADKPGGGSAPQRILVLGGTTEASALARALAPRAAAFDVTLSLAGRTRDPRPEPVRTRVGGFGGAEGLAAWIGAHAVDCVIDATHPFAARISRNAAAACAATGVPRLAVRRPAWARAAGDDWTEVDGMAEAVAALGPAPRRVFLTIGRGELAAFAAAPQHWYHARTIEPIGAALSVPRLAAVAARGPFTREAELAFLVDNRIEVVVTKNSGGVATYAKIEAARAAGLPVIVVRRPDAPDGPAVPDAAAALGWLLAWAAARDGDQPATLRGV